MKNDFESMLNKCESKKHASILFNYKRLRLKIDFTIDILKLFMFLFEIVCFCSNLITVVIVSHKKNKQDLKEKRYLHFIRINAISNCLILLINFLNSNYFKKFFGNEFNEYFRMVFLQVLQIINRFIFNTLLFISSISYTSFTLCRISLLGREHGKLVTWISTVSLRKFLALTIFICVLFNLVTFLEFRVNVDYDMFDFPIPFTSFPNFETTKSILVKITLILTTLRDFTFSIVLVLLQLVVDICLVQLRQTLNNQMTSGKSDNQKQTMKNKNEPY